MLRPIIKSNQWNCYRVWAGLCINSKKLSNNLYSLSLGVCNKLDKWKINLGIKDLENKS